MLLQRKAFFVSKKTIVAFSIRIPVSLVTVPVLIQIAAQIRHSLRPPAVPSHIAPIGGKSSSVLRTYL
jgi:hypothetical protein